MRILADALSPADYHYLVELIDVAVADLRQTADHAGDTPAARKLKRYAGRAMALRRKLEPIGTPCEP